MRWKLAGLLAYAVGTVAITTAVAATFAYRDAKERPMYQPEGVAARQVLAEHAYQLSLSSDGKKVAATIDIQPSPKRKLIAWDSATGQTRELVRGFVALPRWSPDGASIAFTQDLKDKWQLFVLPVADPAKVRMISPAEVHGIAGWTGDGQAIVFFDSVSLQWIGLDGKTRRSVPLTEIYGGTFDWSSSDTFRFHPSNPNLLAVSAAYMDTPKGAAMDEMDRGSAVFLYDLGTKKRTPVVQPAVWAYDGVWSADGAWIYFTRLQKKRFSIWRVHPDGGGLEFVVDGAQPELSR